MAEPVKPLGTINLEGAFAPPERRPPKNPEPAPPPPQEQPQPPVPPPAAAPLSNDQADAVLARFAAPREEPKNRTGTLKAPQFRQRDQKDTVKLSFVIPNDLNELLRRVMSNFPSHLRRNEVVTKVLEQGLRDIEIAQLKQIQQRRRTG